MSEDVKSEKELSIPWVEKYRPDEIDNIVLPEKTKKVFKALIKKGGDKLPNFLFSGLSGVGKTTLAKAIVKELGVTSYLYINASDENGIDTIRTKVSTFCSTMSVDNEIKILILDEADGISFQGQRALNNIIESSNTTRFFFTCNYPEKITPALRSRLKEVVFKQADIKDVRRLMGRILKAEGIDFSDTEQKKLLLKMIDKYYPDMREIINHLQYFCSSGELEIDLDEVVADDTYDTVINQICQGKIMSLWETMRNNKLDFDGIIKRIFHDLLNKKELFGEVENTTLSQLILLCCEFKAKSNEVVDKEMNFMQFAIEIMEVE